MKIRNGAPFVFFPVSDRSARLKEMQERQEELQLNNKRLRQEEQHLRDKYHEVTWRDISLILCKNSVTYL